MLVLLADADLWLLSAVLEAHAQSDMASMLFAVDCSVRHGQPAVCGSLLASGSTRCKHVMLVALLSPQVLNHVQSDSSMPWGVAVVCTCRFPEGGVGGAAPAPAAAGGAAAPAAGNAFASGAAADDDDDLYS